jgi:NAD(P)-dependent dehydrogenase (short-subunit alcohol dehydrogenase family)
MKIILVTGGNRGIGYEICRQLDALGHKVILGSRDVEKGEKAAQALGGNVLVSQLDVRDEASILRTFEMVSGTFGKLDVLINNAGINKSSEEHKNALLRSVKDFMEAHIYGAKQLNKAILPTLRKAGLIAPNPVAGTVSMDEVKTITETNFYGAWRMIQVFLPLLRQSDDGRIINVSTGMGAWETLDGDYPGYRMSKVSLNALTVMLARELKDDAIRVNAMCPGWVRTGMGGPNAPRTVEQGADTAVWLATEMDIPTGKFFRDRKVINW